MGTDDGNLQLTRDGGKTWTNVARHRAGTLPKASWVSWVEASRFDAATAYAAFDRHTFGDMTPYVYGTRDFGKTWQPLVSAPEQGVRGYAHVIKEDSSTPRLLFVGTEFGLWISLDGGAVGRVQGRRLPGGRGARHRDPPARQRPRARHARPRHLDRGRHHAAARARARPAAKRRLPRGPAGTAAHQRAGRMAEGDASFVGRNPPGGAVITYYQTTRHLFGPLKLEVLDADGKVIDIPGQPAPRHQPRRLVHAGEGAAGAAAASSPMPAHRGRACCPARTPCG